MNTLKPVGKPLPNPPETHKVEPENPQIYPFFRRNNPVKTIKLSIKLDN